MPSLAMVTFLAWFWALLAGALSVVASAAPALEDIIANVAAAASAVVGNAVDCRALVLVATNAAAAAIAGAVDALASDVAVLLPTLFPCRSTPLLHPWPSLVLPHMLLLLRDANNFKNEC